jgi:hypothetical protein
VRAFHCDIGDMDDPLGGDELGERRHRLETDAALARYVLGERRRHVVMRHAPETVTLIQQQAPKRRLTDSGCVLEHRPENRLKVARGGGDHPQHVGGRGLLLQRFGEVIGALAQLIEQPRVLDRDHRLIGEIRNQRNLLVGEWPHLLAIDRDGADQLALL